MDAKDQGRIFKAVQEKFKIVDITDEEINDFLKNRPGKKTYTWTEFRNGKLRERSRTVNIKFSQKKDAIAKEMAKLGDIFREANTIESFNEGNQTLERWTSFQKEWNVQRKNIDTINEEIKERVTDLVDSLNFRQLKGVEINDTELTTYKENVAFNDVREEIRQLKGRKDIQGLEELKGDVNGIRDEQELIDEIDQVIGRLQ